MRWGLENAPLTAVYGGWNQKTRPLGNAIPGDRVFFTTGFKGRVHLLGGLRVEKVGEPDVGCPHSCASVQVSGSPIGRFRDDRIVPSGWLPDWTFRNADGSTRAVRHLEDGLLTKTYSFQGCFRLEPTTADQLEALLVGAAPCFSEHALIGDLERRRFEDPEDPELAAVYLDALAERGDIRAEVLRLELAGATRGDRKAARALEQVLDAHPEVWGRPGGHPFRISWGTPKKLR